jgi:hypothetical protein
MKDILENATITDGQPMPLAPGGFAVAAGRPLVLIVDGGRRKVFLFDGTALVVGRDKPSKNPQIGLCLRRLPCERTHLANWEVSCRISHRHATLAWRAGGFSVRDESSENGTFLGGSNITAAADLPGSVSDVAGTVAENNLADGFLQCVAGEWVQLPPTGVLRLGRELLALPFVVLASGGAAGALWIGRSGNCEHHHYLLLAPGGAADFGALGIAGLAGMAVRSHGTRFELVADSRGFEDDAATIPPGGSRLLESGLRVTAGRLTIDVRAATDDEMITP